MESKSQGLSGGGSVRLPSIHSSRRSSSRDTPVDTNTSNVNDLGFDTTLHPSQTLRAVRKRLKNIEQTSFVLTSGRLHPTADQSGRGADSASVWLLKEEDAAAQRFKLDEMKAVARYLEQKSLGLTRTRTERGLLTQLTSLLSVVWRENQVFTDQYAALSAGYVAQRNQRMAVEQRHSSMLSQLNAVGFDAWGDNFKLQESISRLEAELHRIAPGVELPASGGDSGQNGGSSGSSDAPKLLHPTAYLVHRKFWLLEQIIYQLKRDAAVHGVKDGLAGAAVESKTAGAAGVGAGAGLQANNNTNAKKDGDINNNNPHNVVQRLMEENRALKRRAQQMEEQFRELRSEIKQSQLTGIGGQGGAGGAAGGAGASKSGTWRNSAAGSQSGGNSVPLISLHPLVFSFLSQYDNMTVELFQKYAQGNPVTRRASYAEIKRARNTIDWEEMLQMCRDYRITPQLLPASGLKRVFRACNEASQYVLDNDTSTVTYYEFKEFLARLGLTVFSKMEASSPLEHIRAFFYYLDVTWQDRVFAEIQAAQQKARQLMGGGVKPASGGDSSSTSSSDYNRTVRESSRRAGAGVQGSSRWQASHSQTVGRMRSLRSSQRVGTTGRTEYASCQQLLGHFDAALQQIFMHFGSLRHTSQYARAQGVLKAGNTGVSAKQPSSLSGGGVAGEVGARIWPYGPRTMLTWSLPEFARALDVLGLYPSAVNRFQILALFDAATDPDVHALPTEAAADSKSSANGGGSRSSSLAGSRKGSAANLHSLFSSMGLPNGRSSRKGQGRRSLGSSRGNSRSGSIQAGSSGGVVGRSLRALRTTDAAETNVDSFPHRLMTYPAFKEALVHMGVLLCHRQREAGVTEVKDLEDEVSLAELDADLSIDYSSGTVSSVYGLKQVIITMMRLHQHVPADMPAWLQQKEQVLDSVQGIGGGAGAGAVSGGQGATSRSGVLPSKDVTFLTACSAQQVFSPRNYQLLRIFQFYGSEAGGAHDASPADCDGILGEKKASERQVDVLDTHISLSQCVSMLRDFQVHPQLIATETEVRAVYAETVRSSAAGVGGASDDSATDTTDCALSTEEQVAQACAKTLCYAEFLEFLARVCSRVSPYALQVLNPKRPLGLFVEHIVSQYDDGFKARAYAKQSLVSKNALLSNAVVVPPSPFGGNNSSHMTFAWIKPDVVKAGRADDLIRRIEEEGFTIVAQSTLQLTPYQVNRFYSEHITRSFFPKLLQFMISGPSIALALQRSGDCIGAWRQLCGPTDPTEALHSHPHSLRALFGSDKTQNAVHGSDSEEAAHRELQLIFTDFKYNVQNTFAWLKPHVVAAGETDKILATIESDGFEVVRQKRIRLSAEQVRQFYAEHVGKSFFPNLLQAMTAGPAVGLELRQPFAVRRWRKLCGPTDPSKAKTSDPFSLRARFGEGVTLNAVHGSDSVHSADRELRLVFEAFEKPQLTFAWLKPDICAHPERVDAILKRIRSEGFEIVEQRSVKLDKELAGRFYQEHMSRPFFASLLDFMTSGPAIALALRKGNGISEWRQLCGPTNPEQARKEAPKSLRALYGTDVQRNCVHGSDSTQAAHREVNLIFSSSTLVLIKPEVLSLGVEQVRATLAQNHTATAGGPASSSESKADSVERKERAAEPSAKDVVSLIIDHIEKQGFTVSEHQPLRLSRYHAQVFCTNLSPERSVQREMVAQLTTGGLHVLRVSKRNAVPEFLELCGPEDPRVARATAPGSLRAMFGQTGLRNGFHCSASVEAATRELQLFFGRFCRQHTFAWITPDALARGYHVPILKRILKEGFEIVRQKQVRLSKEQATRFFALSGGQARSPRPGPESKGGSGSSDQAARVQLMTSGPCIALDLRKPDAVKAFRRLAGPLDTVACRQTHPNSIRASFNASPTQPTLYCAQDKVSAERELELVFGDFVPACSVQTTFAWIKPDAVAAGHTDAILARIQKEGFQILKQRQLRLTPEIVRAFYAEHVDKPFFPRLSQFMTSGPAVALCLRKVGAVKTWRQLCGPTSSAEARTAAPQALRALYGKDKTRNAVHGSDSPQAAARECDLVLGDETFMWIKPDAVASGFTGEILERLAERGFNLVEQQEISLTREQVCQFYAHHQSKPWFANMVRFMSSGPAVALTLRKEGAVVTARQLCGPVDPEEARVTDPDSFRALYGVDVVRNAVHVSESAVHAWSELDLVFNRFSTQQATLVCVSPHCVNTGQFREIRERLLSASGLRLVGEAQTRLSMEQADQLFVSGLDEKQSRSSTLDYYTSGDVHLMAVEGANAVVQVLQMAGPPVPAVAVKSHPQSFRAVYGQDLIQNGVYVPLGVSDGRRAVQLAFKQFKLAPQTTVLVVRPEVVAGGSKLQAVLSTLQEHKFEVLGEQTQKLRAPQAQKLLAGLRSAPGFRQMVKSLCSGSCVALMVRRVNAVEALKQLVGPLDPKEAQKTHPQSLRAVYGTTEVRNGFYCSDSVQTVANDVQLLFPSDL